jgi:DNA polymerase-3 subunit alpha
MMGELMKETFGVMVYQEDVIKVAHHFAGLDIGKADILRRAMSGKFRGDEEMKRIREKFFANCDERGYEQGVTQEVWRQISSFAGYSFSKAHSASFAVESFQDLYLKTYYPMEFMVGVINNFGGFYKSSPFVYFYELKKAGASLHLPCINTSDVYTNICGRDVHIGFQHVKELQGEMAQRIVEERKRHGSYLHLPDLIERTAITPEQLNILIQIGALRFTGKSKKQLLWQANFFLKKMKSHVPASESMFNEKPVEFELPALSDHPLDDWYDELEMLGFLIDNPFPIVDEDPARYPVMQEVKKSIAVGDEVTMLGYYVERKVVPTNRGEMSFMTFLDRSLDWINAVLFPEVCKRHPFAGHGFYRVTGKLVEEYGYYSLDVSSFRKVGYKERKYANL